MGKTASKLWKMRQLNGNAVSAVHPMWIQAWRMGGISSYCEAMLSLPFQLLYVDSTPLMGGIPALSTQNIAR